MQFSRAYLCYSCHEVLENAPHGKCQACDSSDVYPLSWFGRSEEEKNRWFGLISGDHKQTARGGGFSGNEPALMPCFKTAGFDSPLSLKN